MTTVGLISAPVASHLMNAIALGNALQLRGHRATVFSIADARRTVEDAGIGFHAIGEKSHPAGTLPASLKQLGRLKGWAGLKFTVREIVGMTQMLCEELPQVLRLAKPEVLLIDQHEPAAMQVAQYLSIPYINFTSALMINREADIPPFFTAWTYRKSAVARLRNRLGYAAFDWLTMDIRRTLARYRSRWSLPANSGIESLLSPTAQIVQEFEAFDFPRTSLDSVVHRVGPLRLGRQVNQVAEFPWSQLDGRPLIYVSFGTQQNQLVNLFHRIATACASLDVQLVISLGGGAAELPDLPGSPLVVAYAPQRELLQVASLVITHGGFNTALECLSFGVPMLVMPVTNDQPGVAARVEFSGTGRVASIRCRSSQKLAATIESLVEDRQTRSRAEAMAQHIANAGGLQQAIAIIEQTLRTGRRAIRAPNTPTARPLLDHSNSAECTKDY